MNKVLSISRTVMPDLTVINYTNGMVKPEVINFDEVMKHSVKEVVKKYNHWYFGDSRGGIHMIEPVNTPRPGGVCFEDHKESLLKQAKDIIGGQNNDH